MTEAGGFANLLWFSMVMALCLFRGCLHRCPAQVRSGLSQGSMWQNEGSHIKQGNNVSAPSQINGCCMQGVDAQSQYNLGHLLLSFLHLFGNTFDYQAKAVSVRMVSHRPSHIPCITWFVKALKSLSLLTPISRPSDMDVASLHCSAGVPLLWTLSKDQVHVAGRHSEEGEGFQAEGQALPPDYRGPAAAWHRHWLRGLQH